MRLSSNPNDPEYQRWYDIYHSGHKITVFLDGGILRYCEMADEEKGEVRVLEQDEDGSILQNDYGDLLRKTLTGKVKIYIEENK